MSKNIVTSIAVVLGALGLILILAGAAFGLLPTNLSIFAALVCWIVAGVIRTIVKKTEKKEKE